MDNQNSREILKKENISVINPNKEVLGEKELKLKKIYKELYEPLVNSGFVKKLYKDHVSLSDIKPFADLFTRFAFQGMSGALHNVFVNQKIFGNDLSSKIEKYFLPGPGEIDENSQDFKKYQRLYLNLCAEFNPDILYSCFIWPATEMNNGNKLEYNLFVLKKSQLKKDELEEITKRGENMLGVLDYSVELCCNNGNKNPFEKLINLVQGVVLRADPFCNKPYAKKGIIMDYYENFTTINGRSGYLVENKESGKIAILKNTGNEKKFKYLKGKSAIYHQKGLENGNEYPYAELIAHEA